MTPARALGPGLLAAALVCGSLAALGTPAHAADPAGQALARLDADADGALTIRRDDSGDVGFVGVPERAEVDNPAVTSTSKASAAADAHLKRYGAAVGAEAAGTTLTRTGAQETVTGDVVRYQQRVDGVPVLGGQIVVSMGSDREVSSILAETSDATSVADATVTEGAALGAARAAFVKRNGAGDLAAESDGRWLLDAGLIGGDPAQADRTVWRIHVSRGVDERRQILVDGRTGGIVMDTDEIHHVNRVVCDDNNAPRNENLDPPPCTGPTYARSEGGPTSANPEVNTAFELGGAVSELYAAIGVDLTAVIGRMTSGGAKAIAQTVDFCPTSTPLPGICPGYENAFWNGSQMYYGDGYAGADDVVGHEMTHGVTERTSNLFYWGQSGAINESISDIMGEIVDHQNPSSGDSATNWSLGEDVPGYSPSGLRNMQDPTLFGDPDATTSSHYKLPETGSYPDQDGVHKNSGVGNKTFYLISQGGTFNGQSITGIDLGDPGLTKSAKLWLLVDQTLTSGSDYADLAAVLDQSCQALLARGLDGFTATDCTAVHKGTLATELRDTPVNNAQPADAEATCPAGTVLRTLFDSETGNPASKFVAGATWSRDGVPGWGQVAHSGPDAWASSAPAGAQSSALVMADAIALPADQGSYLIFDHWRLLEWGPGIYEGGTVEVDDTEDAVGPIDVASKPWVNGPTQVINGGSNPANGRLGFGGDSRGYIASSLDLSSFAGRTIKPRFTMNLNSVNAYIGWFVDDITVYTCDDEQILNTARPTISGTARVGSTLTAGVGLWTPDNSPDFSYQWHRGGELSKIPGATGATYTPTAADLLSPISVRVTASKPGYYSDSNFSDPTTPVHHGLITAGTPTVTGTPRVGSTMTGTAGTWAPSDVSLKYEWLRNDSKIPGADRLTYVVTSADRGNTLSLRVWATKTAFGPVMATSAPSAKVGDATLVKGKPSIKGKAQVGKRLTAVAGSWQPVDTRFDYQWLRNGKVIKGATKIKYKLGAADRGKRISVRIAGMKVGYQTATATSKATGKVKAKAKKRR